MTTTEHLEKIKAKCHELYVISPSYGSAEAGWLSTAEEADGLISILTLREINGESVQGYAFRRAKQLIAAWPEELL